MTAILGKMRGDRGDLGDLMPARVALVVPRVEAVRTAATGLRDEVDDRIPPLKGHQLTMVARMARLTTGFAATLDAPSPQTLSSCEAIGCGRLALVHNSRSRSIIALHPEIRGPA